MTTTLDNLAGHVADDAHHTIAREVSNFPDDHWTRDAHIAVVVGEQAPGWANEGPVPETDAPTRDSTRQGAASVESTPKSCAPHLADPVLALAAAVLDDLERVRIANENRLRQLTRGADEVDADGRNDRGFGLTLDHPDVTRLSVIVATLSATEHQAELNLGRLMRAHPLGPWVKQARGVGEKQGARLLAAVGDPYWNDLYGRPRTVSELWAYCGYHVLRTGQTRADAHTAVAGSAQLPAGHGGVDNHTHHAGGTQLGSDPDHVTGASHDATVGVATARARGQRANWSADAKMRAHLVAASTMKALRAPCAKLGDDVWATHVDGCPCGTYRPIYDAGRVKYADAVHPVECKRCGPSGKPALVGSPLLAGHQHARALRLVAKAVLRDLWIEAKRLHELHGGHTGLDVHPGRAAA